MITISIPTYNRPDLLRDLLINLSNQTYLNFVVRISDNNSDNFDGYRKIVAENWPFKIDYVRQEKNIGHINNFIFLLEKCETNFHIWLADDDRIHPEFLERSLGVFTEQDVIVFSNYLKIYSSGKQEEVVINTSIESNTSNLFNDCFDLVYRRHPKPGFYKKIGIYGLAKSSYLKKIVGYNLYKWLNERDLLFLLRQHGNFKVIPDFLFEKSVDDKMNLDRADPYYSKINQRGKFQWYLRIVFFSNGYKYKLFTCFFMLPFFLKTLLSRIRW